MATLASKTSPRMCQERNSVGVVATDQVTQGLRPIVASQRPGAATLITARLAGAPGWASLVPLGARSLVLWVDTMVKLRAGRGWGAGPAVALLDPPDAPSPAVSWVVVAAVVWAVGMVMAWTVGPLVVLGILYPPALPACLGLLVVLVVWGWLRVHSTRAARHLATLVPPGFASLSALAKPADDPPGSARPLLAALVAHAHVAGWGVALTADHPALVAYYQSAGFEVAGRVPAPWGERVLLLAPALPH